MAGVRYKIVSSRPAKKQLFKLPKNIAKDLNGEIAKLSDNPRPIGCKKLVDSDAYRIRSGHYRIVYEIEDGILVVQVIAVGHRKDVYRHLK